MYVFFGVYFSIIHPRPPLLRVIKIRAIIDVATTMITSRLCSNSKAEPCGFESNQIICSVAKRQKLLLF